MAIVISGSGIDMGGNPVSNASQIDSTVINENGSNVISQDELAYDVDTSSYIPNTLTSGAIIERGSNANGEYVKYADGTLICYAVVPIVYTNNTAYIRGNITFPATFIEPPVINVSLNIDNVPTGYSNTSNANIGAVGAREISTSFCIIYAFQSTSTAGMGVFSSVTMYGRWK